MKLSISEEEKKEIKSLYGIISEQRISDLPQNQQTNVGPKPNIGTPPKTKDLRTTLSPQQQEQAKYMMKFKEMSPVGKPANVVKKVRLIFPGSRWEEIGLFLLKKLNIFTGYFRSLSEALQIIDGMINDGVKTNELVIGSHGAGEQLLMTQSGEDFKFDNSFLEKIKQIVTPTTKVFFTACHGAEDLEMLKDAAEKLGVGAYASSGIYNYVTNESEKGFYYCSPQPYQLPTGSEVAQPLSSNEEQMKIGGVDIKYLSNDNPSQINFTITTNIFGSPIKITDKFKFSSENYGKSNINKGKYLISGRVIPEYPIRDYIEDSYQNKTPNSDILFKSYRNQMSKTPDMARFLIGEFQKGSIKIEVNGIDIKTLKPFNLPKYVDNDFFLSKGLCSRVNGAPVSWTESVN